uniref:Uncharacterized protein n=1 Tax=Ananas comosus var. bracteatus TaxID=296719 RepID=A0A6V7Q3R0_ANACO|nr:unnamed protein product [Ananas comosus var. bracteatus]
MIFLYKCEQYSTAYDMWKALKAKFGATSATRLRSLTMRFDSYKKRADQTMKQHDIARHLELEKGRLRAVKTPTANATDSNFRRTSGFKRERTPGAQNHRRFAPKNANSTKKKEKQTRWQEEQVKDDLFQL